MSSLIFAPVNLQKQTATSSKKINNVRIRFLPIVTPSQTSAGRRRRSSCSSRRWTTAAGRSSSADVLELPFLAEDSGCLAYEKVKRLRNIGEENESTQTLRFHYGLTYKTLT